MVLYSFSKLLLIILECFLFYICEFQIRLFFFYCQKIVVDFINAIEYDIIVDFSSSLQETCLQYCPFFSCAMASMCF
jgi:hypothetical protein